MTERADVLIVGAGASGGVAALTLARAGMRVVCLEQGGWQDPAGYPGAGDDWELQARKQWSSSPNVRDRPTDYPIDFDDADMVLGNFNGVGGGTVLYSAVWPRLLPSDFRARTEHGVGDDWPLSYEDLAPYYEETDRQFGVSGLGGNPMYPPGADPPLPPLPIGRAGLALGTRPGAPRPTLVARVQRHPLGRARRPARVRPARLVRLGVQRGREGLDRRHALAASHRRRCAARHRCTRATHRGRRPGPRPRRDVDRRRTGTSTSSPPTSCCARRTASARHGCSCCRRMQVHPTGWRTPRGSSAAGSWCIRG